MTSLSVKEGRHESFVRLGHDEPSVQSRSKTPFQSLKQLVRSGSSSKHGDASSVDALKFKRTKSDSSVTNIKIKGILKKPSRGDCDTSVDTRGSKKKKDKGDDCSVDTRSSTKKSKKSKSTADNESTVDTRNSKKKSKEKKGEGLEESMTKKTKTKKAPKQELLEDSFETDEDPFERTKEIRQLVIYALKKTDSKGIVESVGGKSVLRELDLVAVVAEALQYHHEVLLCQDSFSNYDELPFTFLQSIVCVFISHLTRHVNSKKAISAKSGKKFPVILRSKKTNRDTMGYMEDEKLVEEGKQRLEEDLKAALSLLETMKKSTSVEIDQEDIESACSSLSWGSDSDEAKFYKAVSDLYCGVLDNWDGGCGWVLGDDIGQLQLTAEKNALNNSLTYEDITGLADLPEQGESYFLDDSDEYPMVPAVQGNESEAVQDKEDEAVTGDTVEVALGDSTLSVEISSPSDAYQVDPDFQPRSSDDQNIEPSDSPVVETNASGDFSTETSWISDEEDPSKRSENKIDSQGCQDSALGDFQPFFPDNDFATSDKATVAAEINSQKEGAASSFQDLPSSKDTKMGTSGYSQPFVAFTKETEVTKEWDPFRNSVDIGDTAIVPQWEEQELNTESMEGTNFFTEEQLVPSTPEATEEKPSLRISIVDDVHSTKTSRDLPKDVGVADTIAQEEKTEDKPEKTSFAPSTPERNDETMAVRISIVEESPKNVGFAGTIPQEEETEVKPEKTWLERNKENPTVRISITENVRFAKSSRESPKDDDVADPIPQEEKTENTGIFSSYSFDALKCLTKGDDEPKIVTVRSMDAGVNTSSQKSWFSQGINSFTNGAPESTPQEERGLFSSFSFDALKSLGKGSELPEIARVYSADADGFRSQESDGWFAQDNGWFHNGQSGARSTSSHRHDSVGKFHQKAVSSAPCKTAENNSWTASSQFRFPTFSM